MYALRVRWAKPFSFWQVKSMLDARRETGEGMRVQMSSKMSMERWKGLHHVKQITAHENSDIVLLITALSPHAVFNPGSPSTSDSQTSLL